MRTIFLLLLMATPTVGQDLTNGKVFEVLADYSAAIADLDSTDHAMVARGTHTNLYKNALNEKAIIWVKVKQGRDSYQARGWETYEKRVSQVWRERIADGSHIQYRYKMGGANNSRFDGVLGDDKKEADLKSKSRFASVFPLEFAGYPAGAVSQGIPMHPRARVIESLLGSELVKATFNENGDLVADWEFRKEEGKPYTKGHYVFGKDYDFLPVENHWQAIYPPNKNPLLMGQVNTTWEKDGDIWLPKTMEMLREDQFETVYKLNFRWKIGDKIPAGTKLVDRKLDDWHKPVRDLFDETWQVKGMFPTFFKTKEPIK